MGAFSIPDKRVTKVGNTAKDLATGKTNLLDILGKNAAKSSPLLGSIPAFGEAYGVKPEDQWATKARANPTATAMATAMGTVGEDMGETGDITSKALDLTKKNGGVTINLNGDMPTSGYALAEKKTTELSVPIEKFTQDTLDKYVQDHYNELNLPNRHLGTWVDNGKVYMDVSSVYKNFNEAMSKAEQAQQLAIFDLDKFETHNLSDYEKDNLTNTYTRKVASGNEGNSAASVPALPEQSKEPAATAQSPAEEIEKFPRDTTLSPEDSKVQEAAIHKWVNNKESLVKEFIKMKGNVANADDARKLFKDVGYTGTNAAAVQEPASALNKEAWRTMLKNNPGEHAVLYAGGSGSGKSSAIKDLFPAEKSSASAVLDGNLSSSKSANERIGEAVAANKKPLIIYAYRDPVESFKDGVVKRGLQNPEEGGRIVPTKVVAANHIDSWHVVKQLGDKGDVDVRYIDNSRGARQACLMSKDDFDSIKYPTKEALTKQLNDAILYMYEQGTKHGQIAKEVYDAYIR